MALRSVWQDVDEITTTYEEVVKRLENPVQYNLSKEQWMDWQTWKGEIFYEAPPVLMAICMKRYDLVKPLIEAGYPTTRRWGNNIVGIAGVCRVRNPIINNVDEGSFEYGHHYFINLEKVVLGSLDMPEDMRLFLWEQMKKEQEQNGHFKGYVFNMTHRYDEEPNAIVGFGPGLDPREKKRLYREQVFKTLKLFATRKPEYLEEFIREELVFFLGDTTEDYCHDMLIFLLENVAHTIKQRIELLCAYQRMKKFCGEIYCLHISFGYKWVDTYSDMKEYYISENLKDIYYRCLLSEAIKIYDLQYHRYAHFGQEEKESEMRLLDLIKEVQPQEQSFDQFACMVEGVLFEKTLEEKYLDEFDWMFRVQDCYTNYVEYIPYLYNRLYDKKVTCKKEEIEVIELSEEEQYTLCVRKLLDWLHSVKAFYYNESKILDVKQRLVLDCKEPEVLLMAIKKGMFRGRHLQEAIQYCWGDPNLRSLLPCLLMFVGEEELIVD